MSEHIVNPHPWHQDTQAVRTGQLRSAFGEHAEALYLTSSFVFETAAQAAARFAETEPGYTYSRFSNPTVTMLNDRLAALEGLPACVSTASGMAAISSTCMALLSAGDHLIASRSLFGATIQLMGTILPRFGIATTFVDAADVSAFREALRPNTKLIFLETPSNPLCTVADIRAIAALAHEAGIWLAVDNCFCTPILQKPAALGADIVIHSATKYLDGQGRVIGGAVCSSPALVDTIYRYLRTVGPALSPFNAWVILKGLETLKLRIEAQSAHALELATRLERHPCVERVHYLGLPSHPQHELALSQQSAGGAVLSFEVRGGREKAWQVIDACRMLSITANLGDVKTTITHPASTTHGRISPQERADAGIGENLLRLSVGLEAVDDIEADLLRGL
jgi:O-succinylhomoserine sulfhydrylase